ncbi:MAG: hypothetical protein KME07_14675 [Pegethrix bostrychoides GSE-TBD4-15B]|uniref:REase AHJR-like domain-containing protein n=1 Tax=Pegethrix bostrychoides GSE-TBD4-15B TaxID=2839662 RepID=A0A951U5I5_9CYAN|nr:hypothetical protein [Pegethrix bostrychoides GSE-TBD4-15B]
MGDSVRVIVTMMPYRATKTLCPTATPSLKDLRRMTTLIEQEPGWEFELVVTNPYSKKFVPKD